MEFKDTAPDQLLIAGKQQANDAGDEKACGTVPLKLPVMSISYNGGLQCLRRDNGDETFAALQLPQMNDLTVDRL